ncbi:FAD-binding oxidoreductase [Segetibacter sp. 3557_3]|uniref:NAD(P)/FAD-dependent oxidoreductase n=1 Tax=Segetibacter sp. 3557_3 TaxID=2547429 RepID=UPI0010584072|nr:FAD-dependent oxidoreductase [Segetibacter sp. 3557_3]TDH26178.1 FAD-binding oxidoreductase [Segetibacter sp. 3557_3]
MQDLPVSPSTFLGYTDCDYLIVGQGICGTLLSWNLQKAGKKVIVIDEPQPFTASKVASGVVNPVTGRRIVRTWRIEELLPFALETYTTLGDELGTRLVEHCSILDFFPGLQMKESFEKRLAEETDYLHIPGNQEALTTLFNYHFGVGEIRSCLLVDLNELLAGWRTMLMQRNSLREEAFEWEECLVDSSQVQYKDIRAKVVICCEGVRGFTNPYFKNLPYTRMKGEALIVSIPGLPADNIYKQGINIVPWEDGLFWIGSTYEWEFTDLMPTSAWRLKVEEQLKYWLKLPYTIVDHLASERPANMERRPFVGVHPRYPSVGILNGMGAKGCSLTPFFAKQLTDFLINGTPIYHDADVTRFAKVLARTMN